MRTCGETRCRKDVEGLSQPYLINALSTYYIVYIVLVASQVSYNNCIPITKPDIRKIYQRYGESISMVFEFDVCSGGDRGCGV